MEFSKKKRKNSSKADGERNDKTENAEEQITYTEAEMDGIPIVVMAEHVGAAALPETARFPIPRDPRAVDRHERLSFDWENQVTFYIEPDGGGGGDGDIAARAQDDRDNSKEWKTAGRKGRPRGSKNRSSSKNNAAGSEYKCKKLFAYAPSAGPKTCASCDRAYDGDPLAHCLEYHKTACPVCGRTCNPPMASHIRSHGVVQPASLTVTCYVCYDCEEKFGDAATMAQHVLDEHVGRPAAARCAICGDSTGFPNTVDGLREHVVAAHSKDAGDFFPDRCGYCGKRADRSDLVGHVLDKHLSRNAATATADDGRVCVRCDVWLEDRTALVDHLVDVHCARKTFSHPAAYRCRACQANFKSQINVLRHACNKIKSPHCERCDKTFPSKMRYAFHLQFHDHPAAAPMHLRCDLCLAEFDDECQMYDHIRFRHELHDKAVCEVCGRTFKSSMGLQIHRRYHNGSRNFACASCAKSFLNKSTLREHEISHMDVKPFRCHICGQYLSRASRLRSHVKTHKAAESTDQMCYCCAACGYVVPDPAALTEHANKERHGDRATTTAIRLTSVVKCEYCDATYLDAVHLDEHRNAAHLAGDDSEAFVCVVCSSKFCSYSRLTTHKLTHGINTESTSADGFRIPQFFSCQYCAKMCLHYTYFCLHRRLKHPPAVQSYGCDRCSTDFKTSWKLSYHKKTMHDRPSADDAAGGDTFQCSVCPRKFVKIGALNLHKTRTHIDVIGSGAGDACQHLCHRCGKIFSSACSLRNHMKNHDDDDDDKPPRRVNGRPADQRKRTAGDGMRPAEPTTAVALPASGGVVCALCDEWLENAAMLKYHMNNHVIFDETLFCQTCYVPFLSSAALYSHQVARCPAYERDPFDDPATSKLYDGRVPPNRYP